MSAFKSRRAKLLLLVLVLSILIIWQPWSGLEPTIRGVKIGSDFAGGTQMVFELQSYRVTLQYGSAGENLISYTTASIESLLGAETRLISYNPNSEKAVFDVHGRLTELMLQKAVGEIATVIDVETYVEENELDQAINLLRSRVDPYQLLDVRLRSYGAASILFEASGVDPNRARDLLGVQGKLEMFLDNQLVLSNDEILGLAAPISAEALAYVPITLTDIGTETLKQACSGKANHPIVIYLDRPTDAIVIFENGILRDASSIFYDESSQEFYVTRETGIAESAYHILVSAVPILRDDIPNLVKTYLSDHVGDRARVILLGSKDDFSPEVIEWLSAHYSIETLSRREGETVDEWVLRACGVQSAPVVTQTMAAGGVTSDLTIPIVAKTQAQALVKAQNLQRALVYQLDLPIAFVQEAKFSSPFGSGFKEGLMIVAGVAVLCIFVLLYFAFSRIKVAIAVIAFLFVDALLTLAGISVLGLPLGLPAASGLLLVVLSGLNQHIIITNELLKGAQPQEKVSVGWRTSRALAISYLASLTVVLVSILIALAGFGPLRIFAIAAAAGLVIAIILTRPVFARVMESIISAGPKTALPELAKPEQKQQ
ncbi:MAG: hypothetical protein ACP5PX_03640 [Candidatus Hadarchaeum sp.]|uniref:hypothetical protein n=1 Tax=Candidatus Hadarchaeum sp. TaxID=2883567 RepID=UPI003D0AAA66